MEKSVKLSELDRSHFRNVAELMIRTQSSASVEGCESIAGTSEGKRRGMSRLADEVLCCICAQTARIISNKIAPVNRFAAFITLLSSIYGASLKSLPSFAKGRAPKA